MHPQNLTKEKPYELNGPKSSNRKTLQICELETQKDFKINTFKICELKPRESYMGKTLQIYVLKTPKPYRSSHKRETLTFDELETANKYKEELPIKIYELKTKET